MATLHVRSVPDELYEQLRERAAANGRSIGAEIVMLLERELGDEKAQSGRFRRGPRRRAAATPFERFSPRARQVIVDAQAAARELEAPGLGTEHLLLALYEPPPTIALMVLEDAGVAEAQVREAIEAEEPARPAETESAIPFTPGSKKALELALREYIDMGAVEIEPEHLLIGVAGEAEGLGARILAAAGATADSLRKAACMPRTMPAFAQFLPQQGFRVLALTGDAGDWERELNTFAARGYSLVEIVNGRAIFAVSTSGL
jgi:hypothetical protein